MNKAVYILHEMSDDEKIQETARLREKALHDEATALGNARREGRAEGEKSGLKKGILAGKVESVINMLKDGMEFSKALNYTGITRDEYEKYLAENN